VGASKLRVKVQLGNHHGAAVAVAARIVDVPSLQRLSAARGAINSLMAELIQDHIRNHMARNSKSSEEAADDVIQIVRSYLK